MQELAQVSVARFHLDVIVTHSDLVKEGVEKDKKEQVIIGGVMTAVGGLLTGVVLGADEYSYDCWTQLLDEEIFEEKERKEYLENGIPAHVFLQYCPITIHSKDVIIAKNADNDYLEIKKSDLAPKENTQYYHVGRVPKLIEWKQNDVQK